MRTVAGNTDSDNPLILINQPCVCIYRLSSPAYVLQATVPLQSVLDTSVFPSQAIAFPTKGCALLFLPCWQRKCANLILEAWFLLWDQMLGF